MRSDSISLALMRIVCDVSQYIEWRSIVVHLHGGIRRIAGKVADSLTENAWGEWNVHKLLHTSRYEFIDISHSRMQAPMPPEWEFAQVAVINNQWQSLYNACVVWMRTILYSREISVSFD